MITLDLVFITQHILGISPFSSQYQVIAADVNNSETITTLDMVLIRKVILGKEQAFTVPSWVFTADADQLLTNLNADVDLDVIAIKKGDVNDTAIVCE